MFSTLAFGVKPLWLSSFCTLPVNWLRVLSAS